MSTFREFKSFQENCDETIRKPLGGVIDRTVPQGPDPTYR